MAEQRPRTSVTAVERDAVIEKFRAATEGGDLQSLMDVLAPDVVLMTDGGGKVQAALNPIYRRDKVFRFLTAVAPDALALQPVWLNGSRLFLVRNPDKLGAVTDPIDLRRTP